MPWQIPYVDPSTGATFPVSYVRAINTGIDPATNQQATVHAARWASVTCFSLGKLPIQTADLTVVGATYASFFQPSVAAAVASYNSMVATLADTYIGSLTVMSGAVPVP